MKTFLILSLVCGAAAATADFQGRVKARLSGQDLSGIADSKGGSASKALPVRAPGSKAPDCEADQEDCGSSETFGVIQTEVRERRRASTGGLPVECSSFDPKRIKLVTFDVFAALFDTVPSLKKSVKATIAKNYPNSDSEHVDAAVTRMVYIKYANHTFTEACDCPSGWAKVVENCVAMCNTSTTPFDFVTRVESTKKLAVRFTTELKHRPLGFPPGMPEPAKIALIESLVAVELSKAWNRLIPREGSELVLEAIHAAGYQVGAVSNGNKFMLLRAWNRAFKNVELTEERTFSSDFPIGAFKPLPYFYHQVPASTGLQNDEWIHVAGSAFDAAGARAAGALAALSWEEPKKPPQPQPCFVLGNITNLLKHFNLPVPLAGA